MNFFNNLGVHNLPMKRTPDSVAAFNPTPTFKIIVANGTLSCHLFKEKINIRELSFAGFPSENSEGEEFSGL